MMSRMLTSGIYLVKLEAIEKRVCSYLKEVKSNYLMLLQKYIKATFGIDTIELRIVALEKL